MTPQYARLVDTLQEIFMLDQADLDFGIYRIMNQKRAEINDFLENRLLKRVTETLAQGGAGQAKEQQAKLRSMEQNLRDAGIDPDTNDKVRELRQQLKAGGSQEDLTNEVFSHLADFFRRYYHQGDFISLRRYKKDVYAIPYEGEEVKLHWANHDQYYIKTSEYFQQYRFKIEGGLPVTFCLRDATTEKDNNKAQGKDRLFRLCEEDFITQDDDGLKIWFTYQPEDKSTKQDALITEALATVAEALEATAYKAHRNGLLKPMPTASNKGRTLLEKHLKDYTARNSFDYFIHKDLGGFLQRELDFYIKNEVLHLDDVDTDDPKHYARQLAVIKALRGVAKHIIALLAQLENFQKKLWLKKKFVVQSDWCITLDRIPEEFHADILANKAQLAEWKELFDVEIGENGEKGKKGEKVKKGGEAQLSHPLTFSPSNQFLVLDTKHFPREWKYRLLGALENLDEQMDGLLINSENFQALNFIQGRYEKQVRAVYIDPPYNTVHSEIVYKNQFKHSSWLSLINNGVPIAQTMLAPTSTFGFAIDDYEASNLLSYVNATFDNWDISVVVVNHHPQGSGGKLSRTHEYYFICSNLDSPNLLGPMIEDHEEERSFMRSGTGENNFRLGRWKSFYALLVDLKTNKIIDVEDPVPLGENYPVDDVNGCRRIYPVNSNGEERVWRSSYITGRNRAKNKELFLTERGSVKQLIDHEAKREVLFSNWTETKYNAGSHGSSVLSDLGLGKDFDYPKSINTMETGVWAQTFGDTEAQVLDYFAGSASTGHAVINLNRADGGKRKYILVEMGSYFDTVTKPRIQKVVYSKDWKNGKPVSRPSGGGGAAGGGPEGSSHAFKYLRLEGYEDTLNNLQLQRATGQASLLENEEFNEKYLLHYMLDVESKESLLSTAAFKKPFGYTIQVSEQNELRPQEVDLVETFNYLLGLVVQTMDLIKGTIVVQGHTLEGEKVLVIWRDVEAMDNTALNTFFRKQAFSTKDNIFARIYVNGDNHLENIKSETEHWKVRLIEEEFMKRMFGVRDV